MKSLKNPLSLHEIELARRVACAPPGATLDEIVNTYLRRHGLKRYSSDAEDLIKGAADLALGAARKNTEAPAGKTEFAELSGSVTITAGWR